MVLCFRNRAFLDCRRCIDAGGDPAADAASAFAQPRIRNASSTIENAGEGWRLLG